MKKVASIVLLGFTLVGCVRIIEVGGSDGGVTPQPGLYDLLFVIDDSGSMDGEQSRLVEAFLSVLDAVEEENTRRTDAGGPQISLRIGVTTSSIHLQYGLTDGTQVFQDTYELNGSDSSCETSHNFRSGDPFPAGALVHGPGHGPILDSDDLPTFELKHAFNENGKVGVCGSGQEQGLAAMNLALEKNLDFLRPGAELIVVILSDEEDCSDSDRDLVLSLSSDRCIEEAVRGPLGLLDPVQDHIDLLDSLEREVHLVIMVSAVPGSSGGWEAGICTDADCEAACTTGGDPRSSPCWCGGLSGGSRYLEFAAAFPGSHVDDMCTGGTSRGMEALQAIIFSE